MHAVDGSLARRTAIGEASAPVTVHSPLTGIVGLPVPQCFLAHVAALSEALGRGERPEQRPQQSTGCGVQCRCRYGQLYERGDDL